MRGALTARRLFARASTLRVRDVTLSASDDLGSHREKLARIVLDDMVQFAALLAADGTMLEVNQAALEGAGIRMADVQAKPFWEAHWWSIADATRERARDLVQRAGAGEFVRCDMEVFGRSAGKETIVIDFSLRPVRDDRDEVVFIVAEGRDITEKKRAEEEIERKNQELQRLLDRIRELDQMKTEFFANASHELRTPLALILGPVESLLADGGDLNARQRRDLDVVRRNAATLLQHVNDLLDVAKLDAAEMKLEPSRIDVAQAVRTAAAQFEAMARRRALAVTLSTPAELEADVDPEKFTRIVLNLLSNAFKFTPVGGRIRCTLGLHGLDHFQLVVEDSGPGVPAVLRTRIFERFRQAHFGTTREFSGTGLGLAIVKELVDLHGGSVRVTDGAEGGAAFFLELPLRAVAPSASSCAIRARPAVDEALRLAAATVHVEPIDDADAEEPLHLDRPSVLVAEDNAEMRRFIRDVLGAEYRVVVAPDGAEALARAVSDPPDLVVTDLMMPKLGGDGLIAEMRRRPALARIPVLVLSARGDEAVRVRLLADSVQDYVLKPFSPAELRARARNLVTMKRVRETLQAELASRDDDVARMTAEVVASRRSLRQSLEARRESETRWQAVFENSAVGIVLTEPSGRILAGNRASRRMLRYDEAELLAANVLDLVPEEDHDAIRGRLVKLASGELSEFHIERSYRRRDGSSVWASVAVSTVPATETRPLMILKIIEDVGERKKAELALAEMRSELARVSRVTTMGELAASIAHEVNQPLAAIVTNANACLRWLSAPVPDLDEARDAARAIIEGGVRASGVLARTRTFLKRGEVTKSPTAIDEVVADVARLVQEEARAHRVALIVRPAGGLPDVPADRLQLQQVVLNLALNAIDAMTGVQGRERVLELSTGAADGDITVRVRDSGVGITDAQRARVFDAFFTTKPNGLGMGLAISRSIIEAHGGRLWATPNEDGGETFRFTIPVDR